MTIEAVAIVPWRLEITLTGLQIAAADSNAAPLLQIPQVQARLSLQSLRHGAPVLQALAIDGLRLNLVRTAPGHYNIDDLLTKLATQPAAAPGEPARFALYNLALRDAQINFDDRPAGKQHSVQALTLSLPFLSNLPGDLAVNTEPRLVFTLNGIRFDSGAQALPFTVQRSGELTLAFKDLDLQPWLGYLPASLPLQLQAAKLSTDLRLRFLLPPQGGASVSLKGQLGLRDVALAEPGSPTPVIAWQALSPWC